MYTSSTQGNGSVSNIKKRCSASSSSSLLFSSSNSCFLGVGVSCTSNNSCCTNRNYSKTCDNRGKKNLLSATWRTSRFLALWDKKWINIKVKHIEEHMRHMWHMEVSHVKHIEVPFIVLLNGTSVFHMWHRVTRTLNEFNYFWINLSYNIFTRAQYAEEEHFTASWVCRPTSCNLLMLRMRARRYVF